MGYREDRSSLVSNGRSTRGRSSDRSRPHAQHSYDDDGDDDYGNASLGGGSSLVGLSPEAQVNGQVQQPQPPQPPQPPGLLPASASSAYLNNTGRRSGFSVLRLLRLLGSKHQGAEPAPKLAPAPPLAASSSGSAPGGRVAALPPVGPGPGPGPGSHDLAGFSQSFGSSSAIPGGPLTTLSPQYSRGFNKDQQSSSSSVIFLNKKNARAQHQQHNTHTRHHHHHPHHPQEPPQPWPRRPPQVAAGRRVRGARTGANSRFVDPAERARNGARDEHALAGTREIYRTDFRGGTFNRDLLPHVAAHVDALMR